ncbi:methyltransferase-like 26 isoform X3 [Serinus canaria]|uniref:methyltransferase-like 26 isoform X3 n=1 Tax=Serinus canaria TaxID=9135 RepID=UPI0021CC8BFE|nr:methyltransferase-like 26 isoform X3 [Serinus canaria]
MQVPAAAERNKGPILAVLREYAAPGAAPGALRVLEVGAGAGLHAAHFARALPQTRWQPSDIDSRALRSKDPLGQPRLSGLMLYFFQTNNKIQLLPSPGSTGPVQGCRGAAEARRCALHLRAPAVSHQPYAVDGQISPQSNVDFDRSLRQSNPAWGLRDTALLRELAEANGLCLERMVDMPANNKSLIFRKL